MAEAFQDKVNWILNRLDTSGELAADYSKGIIYISDCYQTQRYPYDPKNPNHEEFKLIIDYLRGLSTPKDKVDVYHIIVGEHPSKLTGLDFVNYLLMTDDNDFYKRSLEELGVVYAYVDNTIMDIKESGSIRVEKHGDVLYRVNRESR